MNKDTDAQGKIEESLARYFKSEKGKAAKRRYDISEKGKESRQRYIDSEKGQAALLRYYLSEKGQTTRQRRNELNQLMVQCSQFTEANPGKTIADFLSTLNKETPE